VKEKDRINEVRKKLNKIWEIALARGRCWGMKKNGKNPLYGSHITLMNEDEVVSIFGDRKTNLFKIVQYKRTKNTELGDRVIDTLKKHGVYLKNP